ncbi:hypothetical protein MXB_2416 [Myxobolus squamalis]|nr:hypothetical protein MXB_2416 [Myxobolus squamalis]
MAKRIQKIEKYVEGNEVAPVEALFPKTKKCSKIYIPENLRCGALGIKLGLTTLWSKPDPKQILCTMIQQKEYFKYLGASPRVSYRGFSVHAKNILPRGMPASHGTSKSHRATGSILNLKKRVAPKTKMHGHTGLKSRSVNGLQVRFANKEYRFYE